MAARTIATRIAFGSGLIAAANDARIWRLPYRLYRW
jgi:hypothetical protein